MEIHKNFNFQKFEFTNHVLIRAGERSIDIDQIKATIEYGDKIAEYPDDKPFASFLYLCIFDGDPLHVCFAIASNGVCRVITVYKPDLSIFEEDFKTRRKL
jgi:hypothetical protein